MRKAPIIAIDGPSGSGKSTAARNLAKVLGFLYIDTGAMYRAATWKALHEGVDLDDEAALVRLIDAIVLRLAAHDSVLHVFVDGTDVTDEIRSEKISRQVHHIAGSAECRERIVRLQRELAAPGGVVAEGRDIGTVVAPDAELKLFLVADLEERARRRQAQLARVGEDATLETVLHDLELRDRRDTERDASPLRKADDAVAVDTTGNSIGQTLEQLLAIVRRRFPRLTAAAGRPGGAGQGTRQ
jgi:cytidylate kinase